jgi:tetratricopeptide (TPR) repeat protein
LQFNSEFPHYQLMVVAQDNKTGVDKRLDLRLYGKQQPVMLALLALLGVILFLGVAGLSRAYHAQREALGNRWFRRGVADLNARRYDKAVADFRSALLYSRDNYDYQLDLAEALIGLVRTAEAYSYLLNLWEREPENGLVNLELARIAAQRGQTEQAQRYYHNAIYAVWPGDQEEKRRETRLELIAYLLRINAKAQAQAELIALQENVGEDPAQQKRLGDLFLRAQDYEHALAAYHISLRANRHDPAALAGAGWAAFQLGRYPLAERYLQAAVALDPNDTESAERLKTTQLVLGMDPFRRQISVDDRDKIVVAAFSTAGKRLSSCARPKAAGASTSLQPSLAESWAKLKPLITEQQLRRNPNLAEQAMELVFEIERQTSATCGSPTGEDLALLLLSKLPEGN